MLEDLKAAVGALGPERLGDAESIVELHRVLAQLETGRQYPATAPIVRSVIPVR